MPNKVYTDTLGFEIHCAFDDKLQIEGTQEVAGIQPPSISYNFLRQSEVRGLF